MTDPNAPETRGTPFEEVELSPANSQVFREVMALTPTPADREAAREYAYQRAEPGSDYAEFAERDWLAGLAAGRAGPAWTGTPPTAPGFFWWRASPSDSAVPVRYCGPTTGVVQALDNYGYGAMSLILREHPACQWSPILPPPEPQP